MKYCHGKKDIPTATHFAALVFGSVYVPGDQRSVDAPGHGYPAHSEATVDYIAFDSTEEMQGWVEKEMQHRFSEPNFTIIQATARPVTTKTTVEVLS